MSFFEKVKQKQKTLNVSTVPTVSLTKFPFINHSIAHLIQIKNNRTMKKIGIERQHYFVDRQSKQ